MCDKCYRAGIPKLPYELATLKNRGVIKDWQLNPQVGWRVKVGECPTCHDDPLFYVSVLGATEGCTSCAGNGWSEWMDERRMQAWLDTELPVR